MPLNIEPIGLDPTGMAGQCTEISVPGGGRLRSSVPWGGSTWQLSPDGTGDNWTRVDTDEDLAREVTQLLAISSSQGQSITIIGSGRYPTRYVIPPEKAPILRIS